ncbi:MAG: NusG domain II-containing protein [Clostridia bacterium]|nr:NusG domain II-containing protein [Clostridia bacterium]
MNQRVKIWDIVLIAALVGGCFLLSFLPKEQGATVTVSVDGAVISVIDLGRDTVVDLPDGGRVIVENRTVRVQNASCPDRLCEKMGKISACGEVILCVPNRISVQISGEGVDAIVG